MPPLAVCTALYPAGMPYFDDYRRGMVLAAERYQAPLHIVLVCDDLDEGAIAEQAQSLDKIATLHLVSTVYGGPAPARRLMLESAATLPVAALVCYDIDDIPDSNGLQRHMDALENADISFGDMNLIDENGEPADRTFFLGQNIPDRVDEPGSLLRRNFMGFTNTAIRRDIIGPTSTQFPEYITAVDWWFYTKLLAEGFSAAKTDGPVVAYRSHSQNTLGAGGATGDKILQQQCQIIREHYAQLPQTSAVRHADAAVERLTRMSASARAKLSPLPQPGVWYDDVSWACDQMEFLK